MPPRSVRKTSSTINVLDYGAVGDGVTDDLPAFDAAVAAATSRRGKIEIPEGEYGLSGPWEVPGWIQIEGGAFSRIKALAAMPYVVGNLGIGVSPYQDQEFFMGRLIVDANELANDAVRFDRLSALSLLDQVRATGAIDHGFHFTKCQIGRFRSLSSFNNLGAGYRISDCNASHFDSPSAQTNGREGFIIDSPEFSGGCQFTAIHCELSGQIDPTVNAIDVLNVVGQPVNFVGGWVEENMQQGHGINIIDSYAILNGIRVTGGSADPTKFAVHIGGTKPVVDVQWCFLARNGAGHVNYGQPVHTSTDGGMECRIGPWIDGGSNVRWPEEIRMRQVGVAVLPRWDVEVPGGVLGVTPAP